MLWYVVQVRTGEERDIAAKLTDMGFQTLAPVENRPVRSGGAWGTKEYVLFPGYVFLQMDYNAGNYYRLKAVPGIVKLLPGSRMDPAVGRTGRNTSGAHTGAGDRGGPGD